MLGKKVTIIISIIYGILLLFYTLAFSFGDIPCKDDEKNCVNFCCGDNNERECDANKIHKNFEDNHSFVNVIPELKNKNFTVTPLNRYRCNLVDVTVPENVVHWSEHGKLHFQNNVFERFCLVGSEYAHQHDPSTNWKLFSCQFELETFEIISIITSVVCIVITIICMFVKKQLRRSIYGKCAMGLVGAYPNIFTARTFSDNSFFYLLIHALGFIMISLWMVSMAFEVWYSLKFFKKNKETTLRIILHFAFTHILFVVFCFFFLGYVLHNSDDIFDFLRSDIADRFRFGTLLMILLYMLVVIPFNSISVYEYWKKEDEYKEIDYDRCMLIGERLAANVLVSVINLILFAMCYVNFGENTINNSNIRTMEYLRCVTEIFSAVVIFGIFVIYQLRKEGEYEVRVGSEVPDFDAVPMNDGSNKRTSKYPEKMMHEN